MRVRVYRGSVLHVLLRRVNRTKNCIHTALDNSGPGLVPKPSQYCLSALLKLKSQDSLSLLCLNFISVVQTVDLQINYVVIQNYIIVVNPSTGLILQLLLSKICCITIAEFIVVDQAESILLFQ